MRKRKGTRCSEKNKDNHKNGDTSLIGDNDLEKLFADWVTSSSYDERLILGPDRWYAPPGYVSDSESDTESWGDPPSDLYY